MFWLVYFIVLKAAKDMQDAVHNPAVAAPDSQKQAFASQIFTIFFFLLITIVY